MRGAEVITGRALALVKWEGVAHRTLHSRHYICIDLYRKSLCFVLENIKFISEIFVLNNAFKL